MKPPRFSRWLRLRFSLRTVFIVVTLIAIVIGKQVDWIKRRHSFLAEGRAEPGFTWPSDKHPAAPGLLWLWGEHGHKSLWLNFWDSDGESLKQEIEIAQHLFPEAEIEIWSFGEQGGGSWLEKAIPPR